MSIIESFTFISLQLPILKMLAKKDGVFYEVLDLLKKLVAKFSRSVGPKVELKNLCNLLMVAAVATRWWSEWLMAERVVEIHKVNKDALNTVKASYKWTDFRKLKEEDYQLITYFVDFFRPMKEKSDILGGENFSTIHLVFSSVKGIRRQIKMWRDHPVIGAFVQEFDREFSR